MSLKQEGWEELNSHFLNVIDRQTGFLLTKTFSDVIDLINVRVTGKYGVSSQHLRIQTSDGPDVHLMDQNYSLGETIFTVDLFPVAGIPDQKFWCPVPPGGHVVSVYLPLGRHHPSKPEVTKFDNPELRHQNVLRLDISVYDLHSRVKWNIFIDLAVAGGNKEPLSQQLPF